MEQLSPEEKSRSGSSPGGHEKREVYSGREEHGSEGARLVAVDAAATAFAGVDADDVETVGAAAVGTDYERRQAVVAILRAPWSLPL